ncbi:ABC transporter ATP-binding protein [Microbacterium sp.]|uniref:ABC transporter ATP-binding protein n=1 Tax=Microbacterium sp. TaxID=51671 RepID=UPI002811A3BA|nr:ABC transporter ATP-binding protein [Microbacterium sp.]
MPTITLDAVAKNYGTSANAIDRLDLVIEDGDFMCLLGPSGCGKTTTIRMIAGLETVTAGALTIGDRVVDDPKRRVFIAPEDRDLGMVFQNYALWPHLTVADNIDYGLKLKKLGRPEREQRITEVLTSLGIEKYRDRYPAQLSGGQQQRVALARMLAVRPETMLLDEPLSNLDSRLRLEMRAELKRIHDETGSTIVFVTHDQWEAMTLATRVAVMYDGELQQVGTPLDIYDRPANRFVANFLGVPPINFFEFDPLGEDAAEAHAYLSRRVDSSRLGSLGIRPESLRVAPPSSATGVGDLVMRGVVESIMPTGGNWITDIRMGGRHVYATSSVAGDVRPGDEVTVSAHADSLHVFDREEQRIEAAAA